MTGELDQPASIQACVCSFKTTYPMTIYVAKLMPIAMAECLYDRRGK